ncbi:Ig-like domain-containing protein, partial [Escherichia coli]|uniref:Ig-like domain-containing protein n=1 Tax=Escherichia coli TaxID=562 RepID=UPI003EE217A2
MSDKGFANASPLPVYIQNVVPAPFVFASVNVGATTTLTFTVKPDGASDKAISVHSSDPQTATVTLNGL